MSEPPLREPAPATVEIPFPSGDRHRFALHTWTRGADSATAVVVKDGGDDPDVTHGALLTVTVRRTEAADVLLRSGEGVGTVTKPGLGLDVGSPAINPVPRRMITEAVREALPDGGVDVRISVPDGEKIARRTTGDVVCERVQDVLRRFSAELGRALAARVAMVDFTGTRVVAATEPGWVTAAEA